MELTVVYSEHSSRTLTLEHNKPLQPLKCEPPLDVALYPPSAAPPASLRSLPTPTSQPTPAMTPTDHFSWCRTVRGRQITTLTQKCNTVRKAHPFIYRLFQNSLITAVEKSEGGKISEMSMMCENVSKSLLGEGGVWMTISELGLLGHIYYFVKTIKLSVHVAYL